MQPLSSKEELQKIKDSSSLPKGYYMGKLPKVRGVDNLLKPKHNYYPKGPSPRL
jgi:hypothetical protein